MNSIQTETELELVRLLSASIQTLIVKTGPVTQPKVEGSQRYASVRFVSGSANRIDYGQTSWEESYALTIWWAAGIARETALAEWQTFSDAVLADQFLGENDIGPDQIDGLTDAFIFETRWGEAADSPWRTMTAVITTRRIE